MQQTPEYKRAMSMMREVAPQAFRWILTNVRIWDEDIHGPMTGHNMAHLIQQNHTELHGIGAPFWCVLATIAQYEIFQATRPVENRAAIFSGLDQYLVG
jgi:hypothetical protein